MQVVIMIHALLIGVIICFMVVQDVAKKLRQRKTAGGAFAFAAGSTFFALLFFAFPALFHFRMQGETVIYAVVFAAFYSMGIVGSILAIAEGPLSVTSLVVAFSLILPTGYGLFILREPSSIGLYIGIFCLCVSLCLIHVEPKGEARRLTGRWGLYAGLAFLGNGGCSTVQKIQIVQQNGAYKNEFMIMALCLSLLILLVFAWIRERKTVILHLKKGFIYYAVCGVANGAVNALVIFLSAGRVAASVLFPVVSAGATMATLAAAIVMFQERLSRVQWIGMACGVISVIFLNM